MCFRRILPSKTHAIAVMLLLVFASQGHAQIRAFVFYPSGGWGYPWGNPLYRGWGYPYGGGGYPYGGWGNPYYSTWSNPYYGGTPYYGGYNSYPTYSSYFYSTSSYFYSTSTPNPVVIPAWAYSSQGTESPEYQGAKQIADARATIEVKVPAGAKVTFDGTPTSQKGTDRVFATPPLTRGRSYVYEIQASWTDAGGTTITQQREVTVEAGKRSTVSFASNQ
jgi:uncharacterized protein (TIGR03000 family)